MRFAEVVGLALLALTVSRLHADGPGEEAPPVKRGDDFTTAAESDKSNLWASKAREYANVFRDFGISDPAPFTGEASFFSATKNPEVKHQNPVFKKVPKASLPPARHIRARVNGEVILDEEVVAGAYQKLIAASSEVEKANILNAKLDEIIDREAILQLATIFLRLNRTEWFLEALHKIAAKEFDRQWLQPMMVANHYTDRKQFERFLTDNGLPLPLLRRTWERSFVAIEFLRSFLQPELDKVSLAQVLHFYQNHPAEYRIDEEAAWQDIFIAVGQHPSRQAARTAADSLVARIRKGEDFVQLARQYDNGDSSLRANAEGVGRKHGEIRPVQVESALFRLKEGKTSVIEMEQGFHIVKVVKRQKAGKRPFDYQAQKQIYEKLRHKVFERDTKRIIAKLKQMMVIEIEMEPKLCEGTASEGADDRPGPVGVLRPGAGAPVEVKEANEIVR